jgi:hypothetical protein
VNISARANVGSGSNVLIAGFVIEGGLPAKVLLRGIGPSLGLAPFNVTGFLPQPEILLFNSAGNELGGNQGWGGSATLSAAFTQVGAFSAAGGLRGRGHDLHAAAGQLHRAAERPERDHGRRPRGGLPDSPIAGGDRQPAGRSDP